MTTDPIARCLELVRQMAGVSQEKIQQIDVAVRQEVGGQANLYIRKKSPFLREVIRAQYDGTSVTARALAIKYDISVKTVERIGQRVRVKAVSRIPEPTPRLVGKPKKPTNSP